MLYGVFSDVHSNLEALETILEYFRSEGVGGYLCCGDLVGYGAQPEECLERIRALPNLKAVCGNHDLAVVGRMNLEWFNPYARTAILWTRERLTARSRAFLENLNAKLEAEDFTIAHGSPRNPSEEYLLSTEQFRDNCSRVKAWPLFVGHSHLPVYFKLSGQGNEKVEFKILKEGQKVKISRRASTIVPIALNPGSVGQPRDHDPRASCGFYDSGEGTFRLARLNYDVVSAQAKIEKAGLPEFLALRLAYGQ
jgi:predicted phosphodiesterase